MSLNEVVLFSPLLFNVLLLALLAAKIAADFHEEDDDSELGPPVLVSAGKLLRCCISNRCVPLIPTPEVFPDCSMVGDDFKASLPKDDIPFKDMQLFSGRPSEFAFPTGGFISSMVTLHKLLLPLNRFAFTFMFREVVEPSDSSTMLLLLVL